MENAALRENNKKQEAQILELQNQVQGEKEYTPVHTCTRCLCAVAGSETSCVCVCVSSSALEQRSSGGRGAPSRPGGAQRLSSLTFGCFQVRGKNPQVLTGPTPSQRTLSTQEESDVSGESSQRHGCRAESRDPKVRAVIKYSSYSIHCIIKNVFFNFSHNILKVLPKLRLI